MYGTCHLISYSLRLTQMPRSVNKIRLWDGQTYFRYRWIRLIKELYSELQRAESNHLARAILWMETGGAGYSPLTTFQSMLTVWCKLILILTQLKNSVIVAIKPLSALNCFARVYLLQLTTLFPVYFSAIYLAYERLWLYFQEKRRKRLVYHFRAKSQLIDFHLKSSNSSFLSTMMPKPRSSKNRNVKEWHLKCQKVTFVETFNYTTNIVLQMWVAHRL